jgi:FkbM family methyltransferase
MKVTSYGMVTVRMSQKVRFRAIHPHWVGHVVLDASTRIAGHEETGATGQFVDSGKQISISWMNYPREDFTVVGNSLISTKVQSNYINRMAAGRIGQQNVEVKTLEVIIPGSTFTAALRPAETDALVFNQIFFDKELESHYLPADASYILDLGANIGLSTLFFANRYRNGKIVSVEPSRDNFEMLKKNSAQIGMRAIPLLAAAWHTDSTLAVRTTDASGAPLGAWGIQVAEAGPEVADECQALSVPTIMSMLDLPTLDILKIDVEGAEADIFAGNNEWLSNVSLLLIEFHERFRPGSEASVKTALGSHMVQVDQSGEYAVYRGRSV